MDCRSPAKNLKSEPFAIDQSDSTFIGRRAPSPPVHACCAAPPRKSFEFKIGRCYRLLSDMPLPYADDLRWRIVWMHTFNQVLSTLLPREMDWLESCVSMRNLYYLTCHWQNLQEVATARTVKQDNALGECVNNLSNYASHRNDPPGDCSVLILVRYQHLDAIMD